VTYVTSGIYKNETLSSETKRHPASAMYPSCFVGRLLGKRAFYRKGERSWSQKAGGDRRYCWAAFGVPAYGALFGRRHFWNGPGCLHIAAYFGPRTNRKAHSIVYGVIPEKCVFKYIPCFVEASSRTIRDGSEHYPNLGNYLSILRLLVRTIHARSP
jgi:hypothetical protein